MKPKYDIFISYRRKGGFETAKHLYDLLSHDGYRVSFDIDSLRDGNFDDSIFRIIDDCKDFILIVDENAFDRTLKGLDRKDDWLRQELAYALEKDINVIPVFLNGVRGFPNGLPEDIVGAVKKNGPEYSSYYFDDFYSKLKGTFIQSKPGRHNCFIRMLLLLAAIVLTTIAIIVATRSCHNSESYNPNIPNDTVVAKYVENMMWKHPVLGWASYSGPINEDSLPNGKGMALFRQGLYNGNCYSGMFKDGILDGQCVYTLSDGDIFDGEFKDDEYYKGQYTVASNGEYYNGEFKNMFPSNGVWYNSKGDTLQVIHDFK